ncbi:hypothetical protein [Actinoplanes sp. URMC 104]|uniref:hypothetical protein n=1 Tax=Actinoplanes sp. URMC 104 TaxID=3423409 RepID=UPI003F1AD984
MSIRMGAASAALLAGVLAVSAAVPATLAMPQPAAAAALYSAEDDLFFVRWLSTDDPRQVVRVAARLALTSSAQERAVAQFLTSGYDSAVARAAATRARNLDFAQRVLAATVQRVSPEVYAAALHAVNGTDADRASFVRTGYAGAKERDRAARAADGAQARALLQADRDFVTALRDTDPGEQVRAAAAWATRPGATDDDIVDFFAYGWIDGASLDLEVHRMRLADNEVRWRRTVSRLLTEAQAAELAANGTAGEAAEQARAAAARAWQAVGEQTSPGRTAWAGAEAVAREQAENWRLVAAAAAAAESPNWTPVVAPAEGNSQAWAAQATAATEQARFWQALLQQARDGELRMTTTTA